MYSRLEIDSAGAAWPVSRQCRPAPQTRRSPLLRGGRRPEAPPCPVWPILAAIGWPRLARGWASVTQAESLAEVAGRQRDNDGPGEIRIEPSFAEWRSAPLT